MLPTGEQFVDLDVVIDASAKSLVRKFRSPHEPSVERESNRFTVTMDGIPSGYFDALFHLDHATGMPMDFDPGHTGKPVYPPPPDGKSHVTFTRPFGTASTPDIVYYTVDYTRNDAGRQYKGWIGYCPEDNTGKRMVGFLANETGNDVTIALTAESAGKGGNYKSALSVLNEMDKAIAYLRGPVEIPPPGVIRPK